MGDTIRLTVTPDEGYVTDSVCYMTGEGETVTIIPENDGYSFMMPDQDVTVKAEFISYWTELQNEINNTSDGGTLTLSRDYAAIEENDTLTVTGKSITLDLNDHSIDGSLLNGMYDYDPCVKIPAGGALTLTDSKAGGNLICKVRSFGDGSHSV